MYLQLSCMAGMKYTTAVNTLVEKGFEVTEPNIVYTDDVEVGGEIRHLTFLFPT
jgi:hypothetical protein